MAELVRKQNHQQRQREAQPRRHVPQRPNDVRVVLQGADMRQVAGLVQAQIDKAMADRETRLPPGLHPPLEDE